MPGGGQGGGILGGLSPTGGTGGDIQLAMQLAAVLSDKRLKENFERIDNALDKVNQLEGQTYNFKGKDSRDGGLIAQELEKVLPDAVVERDGVKYVKYEAVIGLLINAVNELAGKVA